MRRLRTTRGLDRLIPNPTGPPPAALDIYRAAKLGGVPVEKLTQEIRRYRPDVHRQPDADRPRHQAGRLHRHGRAATAGAHVRLSRARRIRRDRVAGGAPAALAGRRISRRQGVAQHRTAGAAPAVPRRRARAPDRRPCCGWKRSRPTTRSSRPSPASATRRSGAPTATIKDTYASGSMVVAGLYEEHELTELHTRINAAHDTLFQPERRRQYDLALPEADLARAVRAAAQAGRRAGTERRRRRAPRHARGGDGSRRRGDAAPTCARCARRAGSSWATSRSARRSANATCARWRTNSSADMPAAVYVRGYVTEYARALRLDPQRSPRATSPATEHRGRQGRPRSVGRLTHRSARASNSRSTAAARSGAAARRRLEQTRGQRKSPEPTLIGSGLCE